MVKKEKVFKKEAQKTHFDNMQDISKPVVILFATRGGAKQISGSETWDVLDCMKAYAVK